MLAMAKEIFKFHTTKHLSSLKLKSYIFSLHDVFEVLYISQTIKRVKKIITSGAFDACV